MLQTLEAMAADVRLGLRGYARRPALFGLAVVTLAVGLASNMTAFSVLDSLLLRPHPFAALKRFVVLREYRAGSPQEQPRLTPGDYLDLEREVEGFDEVGAYRFAELNLSGDGVPESIRAFYVSGNWFPMLGVEATVGRVLVSEDAGSGAERVAVLGFGLWQRRFASDPSVVGAEILLNGDAHTVVGVTPKNVNYPRGMDVVVPLALTAAERIDRMTPRLYLVARLAEGVTRESASSELARLGETLAKRYPETHHEREFRLLPLREEQYFYTFPMFGMLQVASFLVLLLAVANVGNLVLVARLARGRELALRVALGASRGRLFRQSLLECFLLTSVALAVALPLSFAAVELVRNAMPQGIATFVSGWRDIRLDRESVAMGLATAALFSVALGAAGMGGVASARPSSFSRSESATVRAPLRGFLAGSQMVFALVLLSVAVWLLQGFREQMSVFARLEPAGILAGRVSLPGDRYPEGEATASFFSRLLEAASEIPGVSSAAIVANLPASNVPNEEVFFAVEGREPVTEAERPRADLQAVGGDFFDLFRIPRREGRLLSRSDDREAPPVVVVSENWARRYLGDEEPLGRRLRFGPREAEGAWFRIVGVVGDIKQNWFDPEPRPILYVSYSQVPRSRLRIAVRSGVPGYGLVEPLRVKLAALDPHQALSEPSTLEDEIADSLAPLEIIGLLLLFFAGIALLLSTTGVYGVVSASVSERRRELGVRMALGARAPQVLSQVLRETTRLTAVALGIALPSTFALNLLLAGRLFGVVVVSPWTLGATALVLASMAAAAAYVPARAATRLDPVVALRWE